MLQAKYNVPVLFLIYNRPDLTEKVWSEISTLKPEKLFIAADGPKNPAGKNICEETRNITENITWKCEVKRRYRETNLGCRNAVSDAITWFFDEVEEGVILEDDCLPNLSFFFYCKEMLEYFRYDETVGHINGSNHMKKSNKPVNASFYFSKYAHVWGWATWKRVWINYDPYINEDHFTKLEFNSFTEKVYWWDKFSKTSSFQINTWDYQYLFMLWQKKLKTLMPRQNLIKNIGIDSRATHNNIFNYRIKRYIKRSREDIEEMVYPLNQEVSISEDKTLFDRLYKRFIISSLYLIVKFYFFTTIIPFLNKNLYPLLRKRLVNAQYLLFRLNVLIPGKGKYISP